MDGRNTPAPQDARRYRIAQFETYPTFSRRADDTVFSYGHTTHLVFGDHFVANGNWVMEYTEGPSFNLIIGPGQGQVTTVDLDRRTPGHRVLYQSPEPFAIIRSDGFRILPGTSTQVPDGLQSLWAARQVHKGEVSRAIRIPKLRFAEETETPSTRVHNWARLSDLLVVSALTDDDFLAFWPFAARTHRHDPINNRGGELLYVRRGNSAEEISAQTTDHEFLSFAELTEALASGKWSQYWVPAGFAIAILRALALGYKPASNVSTPA